MPRSRYDVEEPKIRREDGRPAEPEAEAPVVAKDVAGLLRTLATAPAGVRERQLGALQRGGGNAALARAIAAHEAERRVPTSSGWTEHSETVSHSFTVAIERAKPKPGAAEPAPVAAGGAFHDAMAGAEHGTTPQQAAAAAGVPADAATTEEPALEESPPTSEETGGEQAESTEEAPVSLPPIRLTGVEQFSLCDAVWTWLGYSGVASRGGAAPGPTEFGVTRPGNMTLSNITVRRILGRYLVSATLDQQTIWQVRTGLGPTGEQSVDSALDPVITKANYKTVASDLTPNMGDLGGRPPRTQFWARDLTERHEAYHADDSTGRGPAALSIASAWLRTQQAPDVPGVQALLNQVPGRAFTALMAAMAFPAREERAYGDGAGAYSRRVTAISALGAIGWYS